MPKLLTETQRRHFRDEGYAMPFRAMSAEAARQCRLHIEAYEDSAGHDANRTLKIKGHLAFPWLVELGRNPAVLDAVEDVIGPDILLFGASIFAKCVHQIEMSLVVPIRNVTIVGFGRRAGAEPMRSAAPDRRPPYRLRRGTPFLTE
jgi:hypothetical protein